MDLRAKVIVLYLFITLLIILGIGVMLPLSLQDQNLNVISDKSIEKSKHIDFALTNYIEEAKYDVLGLSLNKLIRTPDDSEFTNYLDASGNSYHQSECETEDDIIEIMQGFQVSHPNVQSVYMGRDNGAFVRSYTWENYTTYDPRTRPWFILASEDPEDVIITDPYIPITTPYVKIAIAKALIDQNGDVYGVVGTDLNLVSLTDYISGIETNYEGDTVLTDKNGIILASGNKSSLFTNISYILGDQTGTFLNTDSGVLITGDGYFVYYTSPELGWKIGECIPFNTIKQQIYASIEQILLFVIFALFLLSIVTMMILNRTIIRPLSELTRVSTNIAETGNLDQEINVMKKDGEIRRLALSFREMVKKIRTEEMERKEMEKQVAVSIKQIEDNMSSMAILNDEIRNPLTVIVAKAEMIQEESREAILSQAYEIDRIVRQLDKEWLSSTKVWSFLRRYYGIIYEEKKSGERKKEPDKNEETPDDSSPGSEL